MRALRYYGIEDLRLEDIPEPECRPGCVKIKPSFVGICGSDMYVSPVSTPIMPGYSGTADVLSCPDLPMPGTDLS